MYTDEHGLRQIIYLMSDFNPANGQFLIAGRGDQIFDRRLAEIWRRAR